ncbi:MAG: divalent-cation tolerance protein CutA [Deltaproteobacteria bacterium]|jgi:periplasmic divalent cation tolerance protein|nr:divalent-cation tolerance protein CutA [Deltaproteobacteria bacterium]
MRKQEQTATRASTDTILIYVTSANKAEADKLARTLLLEHLVAGANIIDNVHSTFWWKGELTRATEAVCVFKSVRKHFTGINKRIKELHSYETPCVLALPVLDGNPDFLEWVAASCS